MKVVLRIASVCAAVCLPFAAGLTAHAAPKTDLVATINSNVNFLYPGRGVAAEDYNFGMLVYNGLVGINEKLQLVPELAESWSSDASGKQWTFKLRPGVKFSDGKPFVAADVTHTFALLADPALASRARSTAEMVDHIETPDDHTVKFVLKEPYGAWPNMLIERQLKIVPDGHSAEDLMKKPVGTGPFMLESYTPGDRLVVKKNPNYWEPGLPKLDKVTLRIIPEDAAKVAALSAGDVDILWNVPLESIKELKALSNIVVDEAATSTWDGFVLNNEVKPFSDVRVRRAFELAVDKQQLVQFALFGSGAPTHTPVPPNSAAFNKDISFKPDLDGARKLLAEAGYPKGFAITLNVPVGRPTRERAAVALQQMLKEIGVNVKLERVPYSRWGATIAGKSPFYMDGYLARPTLDTATYPWYHSSGSWNRQMWHFKSERIDEVLDKARLETDPDKQNALYKTFQQYAVEDVPGVVMYTINFVTAYPSSLKGYHTHPYSWMDLRSASFE